MVQGGLILKAAAGPGLRVLGDGLRELKGFEALGFRFLRFWV